MPSRKVLIGGLLVLAALLVWAWWNGGEEPLRPIRQPVALPGGKA